MGDGDHEGWRLPFSFIEDEVGSACCRFWRFDSGVCTQGAGGRASHYDDLFYAYDFKLPEGTPILAAREGVVAMAVSGFTEGGLSSHLKARANYVAVQELPSPLPLEEAIPIADAPP